MISFPNQAKDAQGKTLPTDWHGKRGNELRRNTQPHFSGKILRLAGDMEGKAGGPVHAAPDNVTRLATMQENRALSSVFRPDFLSRTLT
jgi:predicted secreted protein